MTPDPSVIAAISAAVQVSPDNIALRLHLASLLHEAGQDKDALEQYTQVLAHDPSNRDALKRAAETAFALGDSVRAVSYGRMLDALIDSGSGDFVGADDKKDLPPLRIDSRFGEAKPELPKEPERVPLHLSDEDEPADNGWRVERSAITLADVAGMEQVKRRLNIAFLAPLKNPDMRKLYGKSLRGGLLLYGPPGCGKTYIARAAAGELGAKFISVGLSDVLDMYLGQSERNLHEIFETARRNRPCVLFFDEIDALGRKRSLMRQSAGRDVVNQLLAELDSVGSDNEGVFLLAATNHPWDVDTALRRPGRLDRTLLVLPPDAPARQAILELGARERPLQSVNFGEIAAKTEDYSGADLAHLVEAAAELAMEDSLNTGTIRPILQKDFTRALKEVRPSVRPWFDTARNYAMFANEGGTYDDLLDYLRARRMM